ncbi:MAG: B12-binding domain-containing radical SAM protein [Candidatus Woesearchaeota archaeon]
MKILFIFPNLGGSPGFNTGIPILSAILKKKKHKIKLIHLNERMGYDFDLNRIKKDIIKFSPDLIGISANTNQFHIGIKIAKEIKKQYKNTPIVFGGVHPTLNPMETLKHKCVDMIIIGEAEIALPKLIESIENKQDFKNVNNLWYRENNKIIKNKLNKYADLQKIPFMDVSIYNYQKLINIRKGWIEIVLNRGCPYNCTYCFNKPYKEIYNKCKKEDLGTYVRTGNYTKTINGIKKILNRYKNIKCISFGDDDFLLHPKIINFLDMYIKEIKIPFVINANLKSITVEKLKKLKKAKCKIVRIGIESGNEKIREDILNRYITNEEIIKKIELIKKAKLKVLSYNMIGLPTENKKKINDTIKLNVDSKVDIVRISTFYPYEKTKIYTICKNLNLLKTKKNNSLTYYDDTILDFNDKFKLHVSKIQKYFDCYLNYNIKEISKLYKPLIQKIEKLDRHEFLNKSIQKELDSERKKVIKKLNKEKKTHYKIEFASYFAVRKEYK